MLNFKIISSIYFILVVCIYRNVTNNIYQQWFLYCLPFCRTLEQWTYKKNFNNGWGL